MSRGETERLLAKVHISREFTSIEKSELLGLLQSRRYGLVWEDRSEAAHARLSQEIPVLTELPERLVAGGQDSPEHLLIEGDNLHALLAMQYTHAGRVDLIYIDPPYNTGNKDFRYNDQYVDREDQWRHSKWLGFMEKRLRLAKVLLKDSGAIFISIDDNEVAQLRLLCDQVFGEGNFVNTLAVKRRTKGLMSQFDAIKSLNQAFEYILVIRRTDAWSWHSPLKESGDRRKEGYWNAFANTADRPTMRYRIGDVEIHKGQWKWSPERGLRAYQNYLDFMATGRDESELRDYWMENRQRFLEETGFPLEFVKPAGKTAQYWTTPSETVIMDTDWMSFYVNDDRARLRYGFETAKHLELVKTILRTGTHKDALILDFFAGSGTTLHATMELNADDGGHRRCILVTSNENGICEQVTYERNRRAIQGLTDAKEDFTGLSENTLRYFRTAFVPRASSLAGRIALAQASVDLARIRTGCFLHCPELEGPGFQVFASNVRMLYVVSDPESAEAVVESVLAQNLPCTVCVESPDSDPYSSDFADIAELATLEAMPDALLQSLRSQLPSPGSYPGNPPEYDDEAEVAP